MEASERFSKNSCCGIDRSEVEKLLLPVIELHGIELKDDRMEFPGVHPCTGVPESESPDETKTAVLLFSDISSISPFNARIEVLLLSGELYTFSMTDNVKTHINTYNNGNAGKSEKPITAQKIAGNIWDGLEKTLSSEKE